MGLLVISSGNSAPSLSKTSVGVLGLLATKERTMRSLSSLNFCRISAGVSSASAMFLLISGEVLL